MIPKIEDGNNFGVSIQVTYAAFTHTLHWDRMGVRVVASDRSRDGTDWAVLVTQCKKMKCRLKQLIENAAICPGAELTMNICLSLLLSKIWFRSMQWFRLLLYSLTAQEYRRVWRYIESIVWKHDVIHITGNNIAVPPEDDQATATDNTYRKFGEVWPCGFPDIWVHDTLSLPHHISDGSCVNDLRCIAGRHNVGGAADRNWSSDIPRPDVAVFLDARQDCVKSCQISARGKLTVPFCILYFSSNESCVTAFTPMPELHRYVTY